MNISNQINSYTINEFKASEDLEAKVILSEKKSVDVALGALQGATDAGIQDRWDKSPAFLEIVKIEAQHDLESAKKTAESIQDPECKARASLEIAKIDPQHELESPKQTAVSVQNSIDDLKVRDFLKILEIEAQYILESAKQPAASIQDPECKARASLEIAKIDPQHELESPKQAAVSVQNSIDDLRVRDFLKIVEIEAQYSRLESAKQTAASIAFL